MTSISRSENALWCLPSSLETHIKGKANHQVKSLPTRRFLFPLCEEALVGDHVEGPYGQRELILPSQQRCQASESFHVQPQPPCDYLRNAK